MTKLKFKPGTADLEDDVSGSDLADKLGSMAEVRMPRQAEEPILGPAVRAALIEWMAEIRAADELAAAQITPRSTTLLYGPPGCGKTTMAHHVAARLGMPLVIMEAAAVASKFMNGTGENLLSFFNVIANHDEPIVVLLDEIDGIGGRRAEGAGGSADKSQNHGVNTLLTQIEKFNGLLIATTNRHVDLDPALWRRFGLQISIDLPGPDEAFAILKRYSLPFQFDEVLIDTLVKLTKGAPPSLLRQLMEGIKRSLILSPRLKRPIDDPVAVVSAVAASVAPHPDYEPPPLWRDKGFVDHLRGKPWPPVLQRKV